jgi:hexosaminidase
MLLELVATAALSGPVIIPRPASLTAQEGRFEVKSTARIAAGGGERAVAIYLQEHLRPATGFDFDLVRQARDGDIVLKLDKQISHPEGYELTVSGKRIEIRAQKPNGLFYGVQSLLQLFPNQIYQKAKVNGLEWSLPGVTIKDQPRFSWRGAHLDVGRHFMPKEDVLKYIDLLAIHKMNVFHWHLTEDQGWRIEIKQYPKLTSVGGFRQDSMLKYDPPVYSGKPHGGFYTQDEVREVVAYAAARFITVVPEIEMPGHAQAAIAAYPELGNTGQPLEVWTKWGVSENIFNVEESTITFLQNVLTEVLDLFPSEFIHIGGDEAPKAQWKASPRAQARMKELGLKDEHELQSWFIKRMDTFLDAKGRRLIGWSEILEGGLAPGAALMVWLGDDGAMTAVNSGHDVVMAQTSHTYFDYYQSKNRDKEPWAIGGYLPLSQVYAYDPILPQMTKEHEKHVLGAQFQIWTEYIPNFKHVEYMMFPRACALSEVVWSPKEGKSFEEFQTRLAPHMMRLRRMDVNFRPLD